MNLRIFDASGTLGTIARALSASSGCFSSLRTWYAACDGRGAVIEGS